MQAWTKWVLPVGGLLVAAASGMALVPAFSGLSAQAQPGLAASNDRRDQATSVRDWGAVGDGQTDDTQAIQRAVDEGSGLLHFPPGSYRITRTIVVDLSRPGFTSLRGEGAARLIMAGPGPVVRLVGTHFRSADPEGFEDQVWQRERMPLVDGLGFTGDHAEADGLQSEGTMQLTVTRCHFRGLRHGIHLVKNNRNVAIADCHIYENRGTGVFYDDVNLHQSNITGCHISYNRAGGVVSRRGNVRNLHITGCDLESNMGADNAPTANVLIDCRGSRYGTGEVAITGCTIQHNHTSPDSANIRIHGASDPTADGQAVREGNVTITGNVLSDVQVNLHLVGCRGVAISGNTFWQGYRHNLLLEQCAHVVLGANNLDRNPRYDYGDALEARNAVEFRDCDSCTLTGLHISNVWNSPAAVALHDCDRMTIVGCTILDSDHIGLLLENVTRSLVTSCMIRDDRESAPAFQPLTVRGGQDNQLPE